MQPALKKLLAEESKEEEELQGLFGWLGRSAILIADIRRGQINTADGEKAQ